MKIVGFSVQPGKFQTIIVYIFTCLSRLMLIVLYNKMLLLHFAPCVDGYEGYSSRKSSPAYVVVSRAVVYPHWPVLIVKSEL